MIFICEIFSANGRDLHRIFKWNLMRNVTWKIKPKGNKVLKWHCNIFITLHTAFTQLKENLVTSFGWTWAMTLSSALHSSVEKSSRLQLMSHQIRFNRLWLYSGNEVLGFMILGSQWFILYWQLMFSRKKSCLYCISGLFSNIFTEHILKYVILSILSFSLSRIIILSLNKIRELCCSYIF